MTRIVRLLTSYYKNPVGKDISLPIFSFQLDSNINGQRLSKYQIIVSSTKDYLAKAFGDMWDSGQIESDVSVGIKYKGAPLDRNTRYYWRVIGWDKSGRLVMSIEEAYFEIGASAKLVQPHQEEVLNYKSVKELESTDGTPCYLFDFSVVVNAQLKIRFHGKDGDMAIIEFFEDTNAIDKNNIETLTLKDEAQTFLIKNIYSFRYVKISGINKSMIEDLYAKSIVSFTEPTTSLWCSDTWINRIYSNILQSQKNCLENPDKLINDPFFHCFARSATYNMNCENLFRSIIKETNNLNNLTTLAYELYMQYADKQILEESFVKMTALFENKLNDGIIKDDLYDKGQLEKTPDELVATAYFAKSALLISYIAGILDKNEESEKYKLCYGRIRRAWRERFVSDEGYVNVNTQTALSLAVSFKLLNDEECEKNLYLLINTVCSGEFKPAAGYTGITHLLNAVSENGYAHIAYKILEQKLHDGFIRQIENGASTMWEAWNGKGSKNSYAFGSIFEWIMRFCLGIERDASSVGYKHFYLCPRFGGNVTYAKGGYDSIYGRIELEWEKTPDNLFLIRAGIPANTSATLLMPDRSIYKLDSGQTVLELRI